MSLPTVALLASAVLLAACGKKEDAAHGGGGGMGSMPPPEVAVLSVQPRAVALQTELPGRVSALRVAQVRARVTGVVQRRLFTEGSDVRAGQELYQIDAAPYKAVLDSAQASVTKAEAAVAQAASTEDRYKPLVEANAISKQDFVNAQAARRLAEADLAAARAAVASARINLDYAVVRAPIAGRIGQSLVTEGALVSATEATQLALIQQVGTVYVNFTQSAGEVLRLRKALASNQLRGAAKGSVPVSVILEDGSTLPTPGKLLFSDLSVDPASGQITLRAEVPNPGGLLLPGQYVRVRLSQAELPAGMLLPQQAVTRGGGKDTVIVVGSDGKPNNREVKIDGAEGNQWIVVSGLQPGEQVIVEGFQKMMVPGAPVKPVPWNGGAQTAAAKPGAAAAPTPAPAAAPASGAASAAAAPASAASK